MVEPRKKVSSKNKEKASNKSTGDHKVDDLNRVIQEVLSRSSPDSQKVLVWIALNLRKSKLENIYTPNFILNECYLRGVEYLQKGKEIKSYIPWIQITSSQIIRELMRSQKKETKGYDETKGQRIKVEDIPDSWEDADIDSSDFMSVTKEEIKKLLSIKADVEKTSLEIQEKQNEIEKIKEETRISLSELLRTVSKLEAGAEA